MASNKKALITALLFLFFLSTQPILVPSSARKILETNEYGSNDKVYAAKKAASYQPSQPTEGIPIGYGFP
ncbi:unnamed protein product [Coffea canephora]|uniref:Uncharacterized protein n=1 Tax=Coffea canephora TaxID=49390 RepID=A0A068UUD3_COFCA|nr:unnamed protein product [Coffea canephora]